MVNSSSTNWIFGLWESILKLIFAGYTGSKNSVRNRLKIQFDELNFSKLIFQKSSTDQQGESKVEPNSKQEWWPILIAILTLDWLRLISESKLKKLDCAIFKGHPSKVKRRYRKRMNDHLDIRIVVLNHNSFKSSSVMSGRAFAVFNEEVFLNLLGHIFFSSRETFL